MVEILATDSVHETSVNLNNLIPRICDSFGKLQESTPKTEI